MRKLRIKPFRPGIMIANASENEEKTLGYPGVFRFYK